MKTLPLHVLLFQVVLGANNEDVTIVEADRGPATSAVILLHGLGGNGNEFTSISNELRRKHAGLRSTRFVFPTAPIRPITMASGQRMHGWYDIESLQSVYDQKDDVRGLKKSAKLLRRLAAQQLASGVKRVAVGGFSQGGAVSLFAMLLSPLPEEIVAVVILSSYLPSRDKLSARLTDPAIHIGGASALPPVLICHGKDDDVVAHRHGKASSKLLKAAGVDVRWRSYKGLAHSVSQAEMQDVATFLGKRLSRPPEHEGGGASDEL